MAQDSGTWTPGTLPTQYKNPSLQIAATATNTSTVISVSTGSTAHNLVVGQPVILYGFSSAWLNYSPTNLVNGVTTPLGAGKPAIVASVTSSTAFTVNGTFSTTASAIAGYVQNDTLVTVGPLGNGDFWLNPTSDQNQAVGLEWGDSFPIQPNTSRTTAAGATDKTTSSISATQAADVVANGNTITYTTLAAHGLVAGSRVNIEGLVPAQFNFNDVIVSSAPSSTTFTVATSATGTYDYTNSFGLVAPISSTGGNAQAVATAASGPIQVPNVSATSDATTLYYTSVANHGLTSGQYVTVAGMIPVDLNVSGVVTTTAATTFTIASTANPGTSTRSGWVSAQGNTYTTLQPHSLTAGQSTSITGASLTEYNVSGLVTSTSTTKIASVAANKFPTNPASTTPVTVSGTSVTYALASGHNITTSDYVQVSGFVGGANLNTRGDAQVTATTANSITISAPAALTAGGITAIASAANNLLTYTATNTFKAGQLVTIAGITGVSSTASFNVSSVILSATTGAFVVSLGGATVATASAVLTSATASVAATTAAVSVSGVRGVAAYDAYSITLTVPNNFVVGQAVTVAVPGSATAYNSVAGTVTTANASLVKVSWTTPVSTATAPVAVTTTNLITVTAAALPVASSTTSADSSKFGYLVKKGGTFVSPAYVGNADASWGYTSLTPSVQLNPNLDSHEIVTNSRLGYPDYTPTYAVPNVVGKTYTNAIQALKAAGLDGTPAITAVPTGITSASATAGATTITATGTVTAVLGMTVAGNSIAPGTTIAKVASQVLTLSQPTTASVSDGTALTFTAGPNYLAITGATAASNVVTYTVSSTANLAVGDTVTVLYVVDSVNTAGSPNKQYNASNLRIATIPSSTTFTVILSGATGTYSSGGIAIPGNTVVTAQSPTFPNTITEGSSKLVTLTRYSGL